jgi:hypothetical protein
MAQEGVYLMLMTMVFHENINNLLEDGHKVSLMYATNRNATMQ